MDGYFLAEYKFMVNYRSGVDNGAAEFLSMNPIDHDTALSDEGDLVGAIFDVNAPTQYLEVELIDTLSYLEGCGIKNDDKGYCRKYVGGQGSTSYGMERFFVAKDVWYASYRVEVIGSPF